MARDMTTYQTISVCLHDNMQQKVNRMALLVPLPLFLVLFLGGVCRTSAAWSSTTISLIKQMSFKNYWIWDGQTTKTPACFPGCWFDMIKGIRIQYLIFSQNTHNLIYTVQWENSINYITVQPAEQNLTKIHQFFHSTCLNQYLQMHSIWRILQDFLSHSTSFIITVMITLPCPWINNKPWHQVL